MAKREPIVNAPAVVTVTLLILIGVHAVLSLMDRKDALYVLHYLAFLPIRYGEVGSSLPGYPWANFTSLVTHMFVHGDWVHLIVNSAWFLAVGSVAARRLGTARFLLLGALCGFAGVGAFWLVHADEATHLIGASGAISGIMAAVLRLIFSAEAPEFRWMLSHDPKRIPRASLQSLLYNPKALWVIGLWVGFNFLFAMSWSNTLVSGTIAWEAHLGGFFMGLLVFGAIDPGTGSGEHIPEPDSPTL